MGRVRIEILMLKGELSVDEVEENIGYYLSIKDDAMVSSLNNYIREFSSAFSRPVDREKIMEHFKRSVDEYNLDESLYVFDC